MNKILAMGVCALSAISVAQARPSFDKAKDILVAQFDSRPDPDDIHSQAALGCMLAHESMKDVKFYAVAGAYGIQGGDYIDSRSLFKLAFGTENVGWTDAHDDWNKSVDRIVAEVLPIIQNGGKVWVQEAGQSNITADWIRALISEGVSESTIKDNVIVVQHSDWNEKYTAKSDLSYVKSKATYFFIDDGNVGPGTSWGDHGPYSTPGYGSKDKSYLNKAKSSQNAKAKALWEEADRICDSQKHKPDWSSITHGGVDFSDCVENWFIFEDKNSGSLSDFWSKYVTNKVTTTVTPDTDAETFVGKTIFLKSVANGKYVVVNKNAGVDKAPLITNATPSDWRVRFDVVDAGNGYVGLKSRATRKFVTLRNTRLRAISDSVVEYSKFKFTKNSDGTYSIYSKGAKKYIAPSQNLNSAEWPLVADQTTADASTKFEVTIKQ